MTAPRKPPRPATTQARVAAFELLERLGSPIKSDNIGRRFKQLAPRQFAHSYTAASTLRGMQEEGWVVLEEADTGNGRHVITEVVLVERPAYFDTPVALLREKRNLKPRTNSEEPRGTGLLDGFGQTPRRVEVLGRNDPLDDERQLTLRLIDQLRDQLAERDRTIENLQGHLAEAHDTIDTLRAAVHGLTK